MRLTTIGVKRFQHDGLTVTDRWEEFDYSAAAKPARAAFSTYVGRLVMIHPNDVDELAALGLALDGNRRIVELPAERAPSSTPAADPAPAAADAGDKPEKPKRR